MIYYVRPDGNNTNNGLGPDITGTNKAWATISKAASIMVAGDTVYIAPGTYREAVTPTNSGSSGLKISYIGDRLCQQFPGLTIGDVIISGINTEVANSISRINGIAGVTTTYLNIYNIDIENIGAGSYALGVGANSNVENCNLIKNIQGSGISLGNATSTANNCKVISQGYSIQFGASGSIATNCILKNVNCSDVVYISGAYTASLNHCIIEGSYTPVVASTTLTVDGSVWNCGFSGVSQRSFRLDATTKLINARGTTFIGKGSFFELISASIFQGCKFKDFYAGLYPGSGGGVPTISYCEFENNVNGIYSGIIQTISNCYFKQNTNSLNNLSGTNTVTLNNCRFYASPTGVSAGGAVTNTTPTYGETDVVAGIVASPINPISGTKSLKVAGYSYGTVFTQWIPMEAGKPKTVKMKIKRNTATEGTTIRLGDQLVQMSNGVKRVGAGWSILNNAVHSGSNTLLSSSKDDYVEYTFTGTGIRFISTKNTSYGIIGISIDGGSETNIDCYNASALNQQNVFELTGLTNGVHKIKVRNTGNKNASAVNAYLSADAFEVFTSTWTRVEAETILTTTETIEVTYTHHKTELVPLFINTRVNTSGGDFVQYDDIAA